MRIEQMIVLENLILSLNGNNTGRIKEPLIHSHISDLLPDDNKLAYNNVDCDICHEPIHAANNECLSTWVETGKGNFCLNCFNALASSDCLDDEYGL